MTVFGFLFLITKDFYDSFLHFLLRFSFDREAISNTQVNKLISVFLCICPLNDDKLDNNIAKVLWNHEPQASGSAVNIN